METSTSGCVIDDVPVGINIVESMVGELINGSSDGLELEVDGKNNLAFPDFPANYLPYFGLMVPLSNLAKGILNAIEAYLAQHECKYMGNDKLIGGAYFSFSSSRPQFIDLNSRRRVWYDNLIWVKGDCLERVNEEPIDLINKTLMKSLRS
ncbi:hypothetical protein GIB67_022228 [Kingdonia uniflora]|uniref:Uncharacterized protein n=1 Tax=Kingdonia uniflora TaxID=39325 RepID=A0A7J7M6X7_9MAGN|nr:hypothetical protein GIB67_022228 [Kingdonia uniflora]